MPNFQLSSDVSLVDGQNQIRPTREVLCVESNKVDPLLLQAENEIVCCVICFVSYN